MTATLSHSTGEVVAPGVYDLTDELYHSDPVPGGSLSSSGAKLLLDSPAKFRHVAEHGRASTAAFDFGHAAHKLVLGAGPELVVVDAANWMTKAAKEAKSTAYAAGAVPLLPDEHDQVHAMADAIRRHPIASALFDPANGAPERSLFWVDEQTEVWRRARLDWLPNNPAGSGRLIVPDYKTTARADLESIQKSVWNYGYHQQAAWYLDAVTALGLGVNPAFVFVFQEKSAPYLIRVVALDTVALRYGRDQNRRALNTYRDCVDSGRWPGYLDETDDVAVIALPRWVENRINAQENW
ncbi:MAG: PD-(D/E)XK nuclease-like domain-containing protein [Umezawaea sp.]